MRKLDCTVILMAFAAPLFGQRIHVAPETKLLTYDTIFNLEGRTADQLFDKTKSWFVEYFREAKEVIRGELKPSMLKGTFIMGFQQGIIAHEYESDVQVRIKDGAMKVTINGITHINPNGTRGYPQEANNVKSDGTLRTGGMYTKPLTFLEGRYHELVLSLRAYLDKKDDF